MHQKHKHPSGQKLVESPLIPRLISTLKWGWTRSRRWSTTIQRWTNVDLPTLFQRWNATLDQRWNQVEISCVENQPKSNFVLTLSQHRTDYIYHCICHDIHAARTADKITIKYIMHGIISCTQFPAWWYRYSTNIIHSACTSFTITWSN